MIANHNSQYKFFQLAKLIICSLHLLFLGSLLIPLQAHAARSAKTHNTLDDLKNSTISIRVEKLPVASLLRSIGKRGGINIFVSENLKETDITTLDLEDTTLYDLFQLVISTNDLQYSDKNNVIHVDKKQTKPVVTANICPENSDPSDLLKQLTPILSANGVITISERSNCFVIQDSEDKIQQFKEMLALLDQPISQIHIRASIVKVTQEAKRQLGISWNSRNYGTTADQLAKTFTGSISSASSFQPTTNNLGISLGYVDAGFGLDFALNALQQDNLALVLSSPQILVKDGENAKIKQGTEVAFEATTDEGGANTTFKEANLSLEVTPKIQGKLISIELTVNNDSIGSTINDSASLNSQEIATNLLLKDGVTAVIGGIILKSDGKNKDSVPGLSKIPLLGYLFRNNDNENKRDELLVFITASIIPMDEELPITDKTHNYLRENTNSKLLTGEKMDLIPMQLLEE